MSNINVYKVKRNLSYYYADVEEILKYGQMDKNINTGELIVSYENIKPRFEPNILNKKEVLVIDDKYETWLGKYHINYINDGIREERIIYDNSQYYKIEHTFTHEGYLINDNFYVGNNINSNAIAKNENDIYINLIDRVAYRWNLIDGFYQLYDGKEIYKGNINSGVIDGEPKEDSLYIKINGTGDYGDIYQWNNGLLTEFNNDGIVNKDDVVIYLPDRRPQWAIINEIGMLWAPNQIYDYFVTEDFILGNGSKRKFIIVRDINEFSYTYGQIDYINIVIGQSFVIAEDEYDLVEGVDDKGDNPYIKTAEDKFVEL